MLRILSSQTTEAVNVVDELRKLHIDVEFKLYHSDDEYHFITCFVAEFLSAASCSEKWEDVNSSIALVAQEVMRGEVAPWNLYLLIYTPDHLTKDLKYKIENDRFAARKITITQADLSADTIDPYRDLLEKLILGRDLQLAEPIKTVAITLKSEAEADNQERTGATAIRDFVLRMNELIPQDRKPTSSLLRQQYIEDLIKITVQS